MGKEGAEASIEEEGTENEAALHKGSVREGNSATNSIWEIKSTIKATPPIFSSALGFCISFFEMQSMARVVSVLLCNDLVFFY